MIVFIAILLTMLTFAFIAYPLFRRSPVYAYSDEDEKSQELQSKRDTSYSMLKELEFDFQSGLLSEEDYRDLEARYKRKAISILRNIDDLAKGTDLEEEIEKQILEQRQGKGRFCSQCGTRYQEEDRFCSQCGANIRQGGSVD